MEDLETNTTPRISAPKERPGKFFLPAAPANKSDLTTVYNALYAELRDKDTRQQQVITWALSILFGAGILSAFSQDKMPKVGYLALAALVGVGTAMFVTLLIGIARDRMGIAQTLDRFHHAMEMHTKGAFLADEPLMPPEWRGWGTSWRQDTHMFYAMMLIALVVLCGVIDVGLLLLLAQTRL